MFSAVGDIGTLIQGDMSWVVASDPWGGWSLDSPSEAKGISCNVQCRRGANGEIILMMGKIDQGAPPRPYGSLRPSHYCWGDGGMGATPQVYIIHTSHKPGINHTCCEQGPHSFIHYTGTDWYCTALATHWAGTLYRMSSTLPRAEHKTDSRH